MVGFFWSFLLKYPASIYSMFLRRCLPMNATHVAVTAPVKRIDTLYEQTRIANCFGVIQRSICRVLNCIFSLESNQTGVECKTTYCEVISGEVFSEKFISLFILRENSHFYAVLFLLDPRTATRYFYFRMRRYVYGKHKKSLDKKMIQQKSSTLISNHIIFPDDRLKRYRPG